MKSDLFLASLGVVLAMALPPFDFKACCIVGGTVLVTAVVVLVLIGTGVGPALVAGALIATVAGAVAGFYSGSSQTPVNNGPIPGNGPTPIKPPPQVTNQLDIKFEPSSSDPERAAEFTCALVSYEVDASSESPSVITRKTVVHALDSESFYQQVDAELRNWFYRGGSSLQNGKSHVLIYMKPFPGETVYSRLVQLAAKNGPCDVRRKDTPWSSALTTSGQK